MSYTYDSGSQLTGISYSLGQTALGNLMYAYDLGGRRVSTGGSYAHTGLPQAISTTSYNADNQLTQWGTATPTYDANGNTLSDGTNSYVWNARNQLASMNSGGAGFQYDPFGRRVGKTIVGATTNYLYDGANPVQELAGTTPTANLLTGLGIDERFTRTDSSATANFLTDALGSTLSLTDGSGSTLASYTYEPFGNTTTSGSSASTYQYTGRENDGSGIDFYRARYYNPALGRFISEDPLGFAGSGPNFYAYAGNDPISFSDPLGLYNSWDFLQDAGNFSEAFADTITFGSASKLNDALGANVAVNRCGWVHKAGTAAGIAFSTAAGADALPGMPSVAFQMARRARSEKACLFVENTLEGSTNLATQTRSIPGFRTIVDSTWESASGDLYYVESKFGTAGLTAAQRLAANALGDQYQVERWGYDFFQRVGGYLGAGCGSDWRDVRYAAAVAISN